VDGNEARLFALGERLAELAEQAWTEERVSAPVMFTGLARMAPTAGSAATVAVGGLPEAAWLRAGFSAGLSEPAGSPALTDWLAGAVGLCSELCGPLEGAPVPPAPAPSATQEAALAPLEFRCTRGGTAGTAWLWVSAGLLEAALRALPASGDTPAPGGDTPARAAFPPLSAAPSRGQPDPEALLDVTLVVSVELGRTERQIRDILALVPGSVLQLERLAGDPLDVLVNGRRVARAEVLVVDEQFAVRITDVLSPEERVERLG
jgi:flagellar motor switch protein FliN/FliY